MDNEFKAPEGYEYQWQDNAVYVRRAGGKWKLFMYFPPKETK